ncbi:hypothetical protein FPV67DRAFT_1523337 [Lyophyllum atratum]|nr:hypothetical protein FPV67DRAFT_1523337 [Lyophyllum atratum]
MSLSSPDSLFMCVAVAHETPGKSFEELRIDDYLHFYTTTGRPPPPCPQEPTDDAQRERLGLPALFKRYSERSITSSASTSTTPTSPADLPDAQNFYTTMHEGETLHSMSAIPAYKTFSHEELRYYAYVKGHKNSPTPVTTAPFVVAPVSSSSPSVMGTRPTFDSLPPSGEQMMAMSAQAEYAGHSLEELRIAYMQAGREINSAEILARVPRPPAISPSISTGGGPFSRSPAVRLF